MSDRSLAHWSTAHGSVPLMIDWTWRESSPQLTSYLDDDLQGSDLLVRGPGLLQGLVQLLDTVGVVLLGEVEKLPLGTLHRLARTFVHRIRTFPCWRVKLAEVLYNRLPLSLLFS